MTKKLSHADFKKRETANRERIANRLQAVASVLLKPKIASLADMHDALDATRTSLAVLAQERKVELDTLTFVAGKLLQRSARKQDFPRHTLTRDVNDKMVEKAGQMMIDQTLDDLATRDPIDLRILARRLERRRDKSLKP